MKGGGGRLRWLFRPIWWVTAVGLATVWVWQRYEVVRLGAEVEQAERRITQLVRTRDRLLAENATLSARERIESIAVESLGLSATNQAQRRTLVVDGNVDRRRAQHEFAEQSEH